MRLRTSRSLVRTLMLAVIVALLSLSVSAWENPATNHQPTVIWYLPHPDDETIGMSGAISSSVRAGNRNIFVFLTQGGSTLARTYLGLSIDEIKAARIKEATAALLALGAKSNDIVFLDYVDSSLTMQQAVGVVRLFHMAYPSASHRTVSVHDTPSDHKALAKAVALVAAESGGQMDVKYYRVYIYREPASKRAQASVIAEKVPDLELKQKAIYAYQLTSPVLERYGVGAASVPDMLHEAANDPWEYRDIEPVPLRGIQLGHVIVEEKSVYIGALYRFLDPKWQLMVNGGTSDIPILTLRLDYTVKNMPAFTRVYIGGAHQISKRQQQSFLTLGLSIYDTVYAEYRRPVGLDAKATKLHWGVRWNWR